MFDREIFYEGKKLKLYAIKKVSVSGRERIYIEEFMETLNENMKQRTIAFLRKVADNGLPQNPFKVKKIKSFKFWEFKIHTTPQIRIFFYPEEEKNEIYLIDGSLRGNVKRQKLKNVEKILDGYLKRRSKNG